MAAVAPPGTLRRMDGLPAVWVDEEDGGALYAGQVLVLPDRLRLEGRGSSCSYLRDVESGEIASVLRTAAGVRRGRGRAWLQLTLRTGGELLISTVLGAATLLELQDALAALAGG